MDNDNDKKKIVIDKLDNLTNNINILHNLIIGMKLDIEASRRQITELSKKIPERQVGYLWNTWKDK